MTLYELTDQYLLLLELAEDPEVTEEAFNDTLEALGGEIEVKADGYAKVIKNLEADIAALKGEESRMKARRESMESRVKHMKDALKESMIATGKTKFKTELFSFGVQKNPPSLVIDDESAVPQVYLIQQDPKIDRAKIKADIKERGAFAWAHLEQVGETVRIK